MRASYGVDEFHRARVELGIAADPSDPIEDRCQAELFRRMFSPGRWWPSGMAEGPPIVRIDPARCAELGLWDDEIPWEQQEQ